MKTKTLSLSASITILPLTLVLCFCSALAALAQGGLTPPSGPISPNMVTLSQIEPRYPISGNVIPTTITTPGSYYLTTNLVGGIFAGTDVIDIEASGVTLDLNGFTISVPASRPPNMAIGIIGNQSNIRIFNGHIIGNVTHNNGTYSGSGFAYGIYYTNGQPTNVTVRDVSVSGCLEDGINLGTGNSSVIEACTVNTVGGNGLVADRVANSVANVCGNYGISAETNCTVIACNASRNLTGINAGDNCTVKDCTISDNFRDGIAVGDNCTVIGCTTSSNAQDGIETENNCTVIDCTTSANGYDGINTGFVFCCTIKDCNASGNMEDGIDAGNNSTIEGCNASSNKVFGIYADGIQNRIDGNNAGNNGNSGIYPAQANAANTITRNSAPGNGDTGYVNTSGNNDYGPIQTLSTATSPWANF